MAIMYRNALPKCFNWIQVPKNPEQNIKVMVDEIEISVPGFSLKLL